MSLALRTALDNLIGKECWSIIGGTGTGSVVTLGFGARIEGHLSGNPILTLEERQYEPEFAVHIECAWRVETLDKVIFTWTEMGHVSSWTDVLATLRGRCVERIELTEPGRDLSLILTEGITFVLFCDQDAEVDNYSILSPDDIVVVGPMSVIRTEKRARQ